MFEDLDGSGLLIHHWDTDGICSARLLLEKLSGKTLVNTTPELGNYFLTDAELTAYSRNDYIIVADMALPEENINCLAQHAKVLIFDHHLQQPNPNVFHHNPISTGENPSLYPSASWIVNEFLRNPMNVFAVLGVLGDHEQRIQGNNAIYPRIHSFCEKEQFTFDELLHMVYLLDSNYKIGDRKAVEEAPHLLFRDSDAHWILQNAQWKNNLQLLEKEIAKFVDIPGEEKQGVMLKWIQTKYNIISTVTRKVFWSTKKDIVIVNTGFFKDRDQIYVRSHYNLQPLILLGKTLGYRCGGKAEVFGAVVPKEKTLGFVQDIIRFLSRNDASKI